MLDRSYRDLIDMADRPGAQIELFRTRALAAFVVSSQCEVDAAAAAKSVTDSSADNGIDAVYCDPSFRFLTLVQTKWKKNGTGEPESADIIKFAQGVRDLLEGKRDRFGAKIEPHWDLIQDALRNGMPSIELIVAYSSDEPIKSHSLRALQDLEKDIGADVVKVRMLLLAELYSSIKRQFSGVPIDLQIVLQHWGKVETPYLAYYGQVDAASVAGWWKDHGQSLFSQNIRSLLSSTDVNVEMASTLAAQPERFWYFNNGITITAREVRRTPANAGKTDFVILKCDGISVVNGAQTVGCIGRFALEETALLENATVSLRIIETADDRSFGDDVTRSNNRQNRITSRDFVNLDPQQQELRIQLAAIGVTYEVKRQDDFDSGPAPCSFSFAEGISALACASCDVRYLVQLKREVGRLYEDVAAPPYNVLFHGAVSAVYLWRCVQILRLIDDSILRVRQVETVTIPESLRIHGNRLVAGLVFSRLSKQALQDETLNLEAVAASGTIQNLVEEYLGRLMMERQHSYFHAVTPTLFKNLRACREMYDNIKRNELTPGLGSPQPELNLIWFRTS